MKNTTWTAAAATAVFCYLINLFFLLTTMAVSSMVMIIKKSEIMFQNIKTFPFCNIKWSVNNHTHLYVNYRIAFTTLFFHSLTVLNEIACLKLKLYQDEERTRMIHPSFKQQQQNKSIQLMGEKKKKQFDHKNSNTLFLENVLCL